MDPKAYEQMAAVEDVHWWFVARRQILSRVIQSLPLPEATQILDVGCGSGGNLPMLKQHGLVKAMEYGEEARQLATARQVAEVKPAHLPDQVPFQGESFDLVVMLDVLEHLDQDTEALQALRPRLKPEGWLLLTVPAYPFLWSRHDQINHHKRRYTQDQLCQVVQQGGYRVHYVSFYNTFLFPIVLIVRSLNKLLRRQEGDDLTLPSPIVNRILTQIFSSEGEFLPRFRFPFGVSLLLIAQPTP